MLNLLSLFVLLLSVFIHSASTLQPVQDKWRGSGGIETRYDEFNKVTFVIAQVPLLKAPVDGINSAYIYAYYLYPGQNPIAQKNIRLVFSIDPYPGISSTVIWVDGEEMYRGKLRSGGCAGAGSITVCDSSVELPLETFWRMVKSNNVEVEIKGSRVSL